jgi:hypothetical protein
MGVLVERGGVRILAQRGRIFFNALSAGLKSTFPLLHFKEKNLLLRKIIAAALWSSGKFQWEMA